MAEDRDIHRAQIKTAWSDAGERLGGLAGRLKQHYAQKQGAEPEQAGPEVKEAVKRLGDAVHDAFEAIGAAAKDEAVKQDVKQVGQSLASALGATFSGLSDELRRAFEATKGQAPAGQPPPSQPPSAEAPAPSSAPPASSSGEPPASSSGEPPASSSGEPPASPEG